MLKPRLTEPQSALNRLGRRGRRPGWNFKQANVCEVPQQSRLSRWCTRTVNYSSQQLSFLLQSGAAGWGKGFETCLLRVPPAVGLNWTCHAAQASKGNVQKTCYKTFYSTCRPRLYVLLLERSAVYYAVPSVSGLRTYDRLAEGRVTAALGSS